MAYDDALAQRIRHALARKRGIEEKKMFGGLCFLLKGNMLVGVWKKFLIARLGPIQGEQALREPTIKEMDLTGKPMKGWIMVHPQGVEEEDQVSDWVERALKFVTTLPPK